MSQLEKFPTDIYQITRERSKIKSLLEQQHRNKARVCYYSSKLYRNRFINVQFQLTKLKITDAERVRF